MAALTVLAACDGSAPAPGETLDQIRARDHITWGGDIQGGEPFVYEDPSDRSRRIGFEVDIMDAIGRRLARAVLSRPVVESRAGPRGD